MEFGRERYLKQLLEREHNGLIKVITGMRRSGKSFLMNELFYRALIKKGFLMGRLFDLPLISLPDEEKEAQEKRPLYRIDDSFTKLIVTKNGLHTRQDEKGVMIVDLFHFLMNDGIV